MGVGALPLQRGYGVYYSVTSKPYRLLHLGLRSWQWDSGTGPCVLPVGPSGLRMLRGITEAWFLDCGGEALAGLQRGQATCGVR